jgi:hypothetical protein
MGLQFRIGIGLHTTLADQTASSATYPWHYTSVSALANQTPEIYTAQGQTPPAFCTPCVRQSVRIVMLPYFPFFVVSLQSEEQLGLLCFQRSEEWLIFISGRLFATGEISVDRSWSRQDPDVWLKGYPVSASLVPLLEGETIGFEQLADLRRIPVKNVFKDRYKHT